MSVELQVLAAVGIVLSAYSLYVERRFKKNSNYKPLCDIGGKISCRKAFTSTYGKIWGIPNSAFGLLFYTSIGLLDGFGLTGFILLIAAASIIPSAYLAYVQYVKLKTFCLICSAIYIVNFLILFAGYKLL